MASVAVSSRVEKSMISLKTGSYAEGNGVVILVVSSSKETFLVTPLFVTPLSLFLSRSLDC